MDAVVCAAGHVPNNPRVNVAEYEVARFGGCTRTFDVIENPFDFWAGEIRGKWQTDFGTQAVLSAVLSEFVDNLVGARVLPDNCVIDGLAGFPIPDYGGLALIGDADGRNVFGVNPAIRERALNDGLNGLPNFHWVVFDPAGLGVNLRVFFLVVRHY